MSSAGHPMGAQALKNIKVTKFTGKSEDWAAFTRDWDRYLRIQHENAGNPDIPLPNFSTLIAFKDVLDESSKIWLDAELQKNPNLQFYEFFDMLHSRHGKNMQGKHRQNWLKVRLHHNGQKPSLQEWDLFTNNYIQKRNLVDDWSKAEDRQQIQNQLTHQLQNWIVEEEFKRRDKKIMCDCTLSKTTWQKPYDKTWKCNCTPPCH